MVLTVSPAVEVAMPMLTVMRRSPSQGDRSIEGTWAADLLRDDPRRVHVRVRQHHDELLPAQPTQECGLGDGAAQPTW